MVKMYWAGMDSKLPSPGVDALTLVDEWPASTVAVGVVGGDTRGPRTQRFPWASVTKLLTATAVLLAVEEDVIGLDDAAGPPGSTVRHLLAHASSGRRVYSNEGDEVLGDVVAAAAGMPFTEYLSAGVLEPLSLSVTLDGSPASGATGSLDDLLALGRELLSPTLLAPETMALATSGAFPGLAGVLPGFGRQDPNDWGLGFELRDHKSPHWTGAKNSPRTFGHFGRSGTFLWVDPDAGVALACLTDLDFGDWAKEAWPALSDAVLESFST